MKTHPFLFVGVLAGLWTSVVPSAWAQGAPPPESPRTPPTQPPADSLAALPAPPLVTYSSPPPTTPPPPPRAAPIRSADDSTGRTPDDVPEPRSAVDHRVSMWRVEIGYRQSMVSSVGYDPFSTNDVLPQFSLGASRTLVADLPFSLAAGLTWDHGGSSAAARGDATSIGIDRLSVPVEGRLHFGRWGYAFLRGAPGAVSERAELDDSSAPAPLRKSQWLFATDVSAGYALLLAPEKRDPARVARAWLQADVGYGWVASERLDLGPALASGDQRIASGIDLGSVALSGPFFRVAAALSF